MKRRSFIRGLVGAVALSMAPVAFNATRLGLARESAPMASGVFRLYRNGELVYEGENAIEDRGVNKVATTTLEHCYQFDTAEAFHEGCLFQKQLDHPIAVLNTEVLQCAFTADDAAFVIGAQA